MYRHVYSWRLQVKFADKRAKPQAEEETGSSCTCRTRGSRMAVQKKKPVDDQPLNEKLRTCVPHRSGLIAAN